MSCSLKALSRAEGALLLNYLDEALITKQDIKARRQHLTSLKRECCKRYHIRPANLNAILKDEAALIELASIYGADSQ